MYRTLSFFVKKDAIAVFSGFDGKPSIFLVAESGDKRGRINLKEISDLLYFIFPDKDSPFAITAGSALFTFERLHERSVLISNPETVLFPMSVVLRGFPPATRTLCYVRLGENP
jgi:hypothetical protein